jgi:hypothetical protein
MTMTADDIIHACESEWEAHKDDCSGFVKAVAVDCRFSDPRRGKRHRMISGHPWQRLPDGAAGRALPPRFGRRTQRKR